MARYIFDKPCHEKMKETAEKYGEMFESIKGAAKRALRCDSCNEMIYEEKEVFAAVLLPSKEHPNYEGQRPGAWALDYMTPTL